MTKRPLVGINEGNQHTQERRSVANQYRDRVPRIASDLVGHVGIPFFGDKAAKSY